MNHLFFKLFELDPEDEVKSILMRALARKLSKDGIVDVVLLPYDQLRKIKTQEDKKAANLFLSAQ